MESKTLPVIFVGHGASVYTTSPQDPTHQRLQEIGVMLQNIQPRAIVCISAHFIAPTFSVTATQSPITIHDHPVKSLYSNRYPAKGSPELADKIIDCLIHDGFESEIDRDRGLDHGAWVPLSLMFPEPHIPILQVSLQQDYDLQLHFKLGLTLQSLQDEGVLIICSGGVTHNQAEFRKSFLSGENPNIVKEWSRKFDSWVTDMLTTKNIQERTSAILNFQSHESYSLAHPSIEHFLPLIVAIGAAYKDSDESKVKQLHSGFQHSLSTSAFWFY